MLSPQDQIQLVRDVATLVATSSETRDDVKAMRADIDMLKKDRDRVKVAIGVSSTLGGALATFGAWVWSMLGHGGGA